ncbi:hypothetical protein [Nocardioides sp.]|uniref:hypothetical protein n=1 Tax=Nocardioides sp. TaxID=35761 RepID=UPI0026096178|nr:hypothetical protein [Nocardioides sp.]
MSTEFRSLTCPCGIPLAATNEDAFVSAVERHLAEAHPQLSYTREQILSMAAGQRG